MQKHKQENAPREYTRDASSYFAFCLKNWRFSFKAQHAESRTQPRRIAPAGSVSRAKTLPGSYPSDESPDSRGSLPKPLSADFNYNKEHCSRPSKHNCIIFPRPPPLHPSQNIFRIEFLFMQNNHTSNPTKSSLNTRTTPPHYTSNSISKLIKI